METRASTGIPGLDAAIDDLRIGDNVVWHCASLTDFQRVLVPFVDSARVDGRRLVYVRFGSHAPLVDESQAEVHTIDAGVGFEPFAVAVHDLIADAGREAFYVFDSLADLRLSWHSDLMVMNFFKVTCPFLYELDTIAYFPLLRDETTAATLAGIRGTTQVLCDLQVVDDVTFVHPLKVDGRSSPTMFFPHELRGDSATPVTSSTAGARLAAARGRARRRPDHWTTLVDSAFEALDGDEEARERTRAVLADALLGRSDTRMGQLARKHLTLADLALIASRVIGSGQVGGKAVGMLTARAILNRDPEGRFGDQLEPHDSFHIGADAFYTYLVGNGWWHYRLAQRSPDAFLTAGDTLHQLLAVGKFPAAVRDEFVAMLEHFGQAPIIVRSSSLLEDNFGNAFAGKYDSYFLANQGSPEERLAALEDAVRQVYASSMSPDALEYRQARGLAASDEQMAILVQRVSGDHHGRLFFPHAAGVGNSSNLYTWDASMDADAGMVRLVVGLGTRAVDRTNLDHARIVALDDPRNARLSDAEELSAASQRRVDVLDLDANELTTVPLEDLVGLDVHADWSLFISPDVAALRRAAELERRTGRARGTGRPLVVADFRGLLADTPVPTLLRDMLDALATAYDYPVDIEFTLNAAPGGQVRAALVQCRPLQTRGPGAAVAMPEHVAEEQVLFATNDFMGGNVRTPISHVVMVDPQAYLALGSSERHSVARLVARLNRALADESFVLIGPGRWGTTTESLGVPVRFAEINHATALVETTFAAGDFRPELSYGSHFFADLVETGIFYAAVFDSRPDGVLRDELLTAGPNLTADLVGEVEGSLADVVRTVQFDDLVLASDIGTQRALCWRGTP